MRIIYDKRKSKNLEVRANRILSDNRKSIDPDIIDKFFLKLIPYNIKPFIVPHGNIDKQFIYSFVKNDVVKYKHIRFIRRELYKLVVKSRPSRAKPSIYRTYINGPLWENRKNLYYREHSKQCARCGSYSHIALHHKYYDKTSFGHEPDDILVPLCSDCHTIFHNKYGTRKDMIRETNNFIDVFKNPTIKEIVPIRRHRNVGVISEEVFL